MVAVNIVVKPGWILERLATELAGQLAGVTVNARKTTRTVDPTAALQYYLPAKDIRTFPTRGRAVGLYTHGADGFERVGQFEACVAMNDSMAARLREAGATSVTVIRPGVEPPRQPIVFGVIGRVYSDGRKGEHLVAAAVAHGYQVVGCGPTSRVTPTQWPCPKIYPFEQREAFYQAIDYLLVTSTVEGGPMSVPEALAHGVPVIAPDVGWCWEYPVIRYTRGDVASLLATLHALTHPPTWERWADAHRMVFWSLGVST